jgi:hypothetical protein
MSKLTKCKLLGRVPEESDAAKIMAEYLERPSFSHLACASIHLYWHEDWAPDADGVCVGAKITKPNELMRTLAGENGERVDLVILIPHDAWPHLPDVEKRRRIFHELCHAHPAIDSKSGDQKADECGRLQWRLSKHHYNIFREELREFGAETVLASAQAQDDASRYAERPMEKVFDNLETQEPNGEQGNGSAGKTSWRSVRCSALGIHKSLAERLADAGIKSLGKLSDVMKEDGAWWYQNIKGIGEAAAVTIADKLARRESRNTRKPRCDG